jgi:ABC-2 type transport system permease protein
MMPKAMQIISSLSPLNWGLQGFYRIFLHGEGLSGVLRYGGWLFLFFVATMAVAGVYNYVRSTR